MHHENRSSAGLSSTELARLSEALDDLERTQAESPYVIAAIRLLIVTGCRVGEILNLRWQDVDFEDGCLRLPDSKTGPRTVDLNAPALQLLAGIERLDGNEHVLPGLHSLSSQWARIRRQAGLEDVPLHHLRHSFVSFGDGLGLPLQMAGEAPAAETLRPPCG